MQTFCIATLTHDSPDRANSLRLTVKTFLDNTDIPKLDWFIHYNGTNADITHVIDELLLQYKDRVNFHISGSSINKGVGAGINQLNTYIKDYKYVLFLEGDWITLPSNISGHSDWLQSCINYLNDNEHIDQILLRRYLNDVDDRQFGYGYWIKEDNIKQINQPFIDLVKKEYTNNPHIRRTSKYYELGIFPLPEFYNEKGEPTELKHKEMWGQAEIQSEVKGYALGSSYMSFGNMVHAEHFISYYTEDDWSFTIEKLTKCRFNSPCKYGYLFSNDKFCSFCDDNKSFSNLERHNQEYEQSLN